MILTIEQTTRFRRDLRAAAKQGLNLAKINAVVGMLALGETLPPRYKDHALAGRYAGKRECHISPDWLLIYQIVESEIKLLLVRTGSHSELFGK